MQIYTADAALRAEDTAFSSRFRADSMTRNLPLDETTLAHFCAFVDFYTRKTTDPFSTALACEKHAEVLDITAQDATPENVRMLVDTMLEVIDHLEKKWLDEQIRHEERMLKHREDVARLARQIGDLRPKPTKRTQMYQRGLRWVRNVVFGNGSPVGTGMLKPAPRRAGNVAAHTAPMANMAA